MRATNTTHSSWTAGTPGLPVLLGLGWPTFILRELLDAFALTAVILTVLLISLHILGTSVHEETKQAPLKPEVKQNSSSIRRAA